MSYRILTIEDDLILAEDLKLKLDQLGYRHVGNATNFTEAIDLVNENQPDLIVSDIRLGNSKDGIDIIQEIYQSYKCPVIYLTANSEPVTVKRALATSPAAFLLKPYRFEEFTIQIDLAIQRFKEELTFEKANPILSDSILLPFEYLYYRVRKSDIFYVEADGAYVKVFTRDKKYLVTVNLKSFEKQLRGTDFVRISRKHLVNSSYISRINGNTLYASFMEQEYPFSLSKELRQEILSRLLIIKTKDKS